MSRERTDGPKAERFDISVETSPHAQAIDAEEDDEAKREREAALASTFDPERADAGKSEEELIAERAAETRALVDVAIIAGVAVALLDGEDEENAPDLETTEPSEDGGD